MLQLNVCLFFNPTKYKVLGALWLNDSCTLFKMTHIRIPTRGNTKSKYMCSLNVSYSKAFHQM